MQKEDSTTMFIDVHDRTSKINDVLTHRNIKQHLTFYVQGGPGCYSCVGKDGCSIGGVHKNWLNLGPMCFTPSGAAVLHEMMHTLGMQHEDARPDRSANYPHHIRKPN